MVPADPYGWQSTGCFSQITVLSYAKKTDLPMKPIILLFSGLIALSVSLEAQLDERVPSAPACRLPPAPFEGYLYIPPLVNPAARPMATVNVNFLPAGQTLFGNTCAAWPPSAQAAMSHAANIWGSLINTTSTIAIDACWATGMEAGVLGAAGAASYALLTNTLTMTTSWYPAALTEVLLNQPDRYSTEIQAIFNSERSDWYYGTDGAVPANKVDFVTVALHELGHGMGFAGFESIDNGTGPDECEGLPGEGCYGAQSGGDWYADIYTRQVENGSGAALASIRNPSTMVAGLLTSGTGTSGQLFLASSSVLSGNGGAPARLYTPSSYKPGSTYSHFDLSTFGNELMKPQLSYGQAIHDPGLALNLLEDLGWAIDFSALPVTWVSFEAREAKEAIVLHWETGAEQGNAGFEVQRSRGGISWETLGFVAGKGMGSAYEYQDRWPYAGLNYYRLQQLDFDGASNLSKIEVAYFDGGKSENIGFSPNPVRQTLTIAYAGFSEPTPFAIVDLLGLVRHRGVLRSPAEKISLHNLPAGTYWPKVGEEPPLPLVKL